MRKDELIACLEKTGYTCFVPFESKSCFDIAAKKDNQILLIKVLTNIDSLRERQARDLLALAQTIGAVPLVIGEKSKSYELEDEMVYERYDIMIISPRTFSNILLRDVFPHKRYYKGRIVAEINTKLFSKKLEEVNIKNLAEKLKISREAIYQYLKGSRIDYQKVKKMEQLLDVELIKDMDIFKVPERFTPEVLSGYLKRLQEIGFEVVPVHRGFDALAKEKESLLIDEASVKYASRKAGFMQKAGSFFQSHPIFVLAKKDVSESVKGVPVLREKEIKEAESASEVIDLVKKREKR